MIFHRTRLTIPLLLLAVACSKKSNTVAITPPVHNDQPAPSSDPSKPGSSLDQPIAKPSDQVTIDPSGSLINTVFQGGSQFANEASSIAANEQINLPDRREQAQTWTDKLGRFWLFSGKSGDIYRQDLWQFDPALQTWQEVKSISAVIPAARTGAVTWVDESGLLHLAGGEATSADGRTLKADHWTYDVSNHTWTQQPIDETGFYRAHAAVILRPGATSYLYGGYQLSESGSFLYTNDLWTLEEGGKTWRLVQPKQAFGNQDVRPSPRYAANLWVDGKGLIWLHAGFGFDKEGSEGHLNDLWSFDSQSKQWTFASGSTAVEACRIDIPESQGPVARSGALHWTDTSGQLWLFGGESLLQCGIVTYLNDLWRFNPDKKTWSLMRKRSTDPRAHYDSTSFGIGSRSFASTWYEAAQNKLWIFGGNGYAADVLPGSLRDVWTLEQEKSQ